VDPLNVTQWRLKWSWTKGAPTLPADFGDPLHSDAYSLCVYHLLDSGPITILRTTVPPGTHWREGGRRFAYSDALRSADGVGRIVLKAGAIGKAKIVFDAAEGLHVPAPPSEFVSAPLVLQLRGHGECWGAGFVQSGVKTSTATEFDAISFHR